LEAFPKALLLEEISDIAVNRVLKVWRSKVVFKSCTHTIFACAKVGKCVRAFMYSHGQTHQDEVAGVVNVGGQSGLDWDAQRMALRQ
jgi:hypothetical protein